MKGILFKAEMVRAILDGRKTQTRRLIKPQPEWQTSKRIGNIPVKDALMWQHRPKYPTIKTNILFPSPGHWSPYKLGEQVYVKETWLKSDHLGDIFYRATHGFKVGKPWNSAMFMPEWASRIKLDITAVRVERLQDISEDDAKAEGAGMPSVYVGRPGSVSHWVEGYAQIWESINGDGDGAWHKNPWVWVFTFKRV